jgi:hypothetical protein
MGRGEGEARLGKPLETKGPRDVTNEQLKKREQGGVDSKDVEAKALNCKSGEEVFTRLRSCSNWRIPVVYYVNESPVGTAHLDAKAQATLEPSNRYAWKQKVSVRLSNPTTPLAYVTTLKVGFDCKECEEHAPASHVIPSDVVDLTAVLEARVEAARAPRTDDEQRCSQISGASRCRVLPLPLGHPLAPGDWGQPTHPTRSQLDRKPRHPGKAPKPPPSHQRQLPLYTASSDENWYRRGLFLTIGGKHSEPTLSAGARLGVWRPRSSNELGKRGNRCERNVWSHGYRCTRDLGSRGAFGAHGVRVRAGQ